MASRTYKLLLLTVVVALVASPAARADMEVTFSETGFAPLTLKNPVDFDGISFNSSYGDFKIVFFGATSDNLTPTSDLMTSTTKISNTDSATHTLSIAVTQTDYTLPGSIGSILDMTSHIGGTVTTGGAGQMLTFQSYAANSNKDFDTSGVTTGPQSPSIASSKTSFDSSPDPTTPFTRTSGLYSVTATNDITLVGGGAINYSTSTTLTITPAPAGVLLALGAVPGLGIGAWLRRRGRKAIA